MKIVVFTCSTGGGHNSCAKYIAKEFNDDGIKCDVKDYMELAGERLVRWLKTIFRFYKRQRKYI